VVQPAVTQHDKNQRSAVCVGSSADSRQLDDCGLGYVWSVRELGIHLDSDIMISHCAPISSTSQYHHIYQTHFYTLHFDIHCATC